MKTNSYNRHGPLGQSVSVATWTEESGLVFLYCLFDVPRLSAYAYQDGVSLVLAYKAPRRTKPILVADLQIGILATRIGPSVRVVPIDVKLEGTPIGLLSTHR